MQLYNKLSADERARIIDENSQERITLSFYKYFKLGNPKIFRDHLFMTWSKLDILGRIYIANEGINAQLSVPKENINCLLYTSPSPRDKRQSRMPSSA